ncbi:MAG: hypothetical protein HN348_01990 [Proteobacteria bacterium]|jgi:hypothetical protein|nr:hypothetical protein [Pseudomonadota bacterium]
MSTKECPSCHAEVPVEADRCKDCFHDFTEIPPKRSGGPLFLLGSFALMAVVGAAVLFYIVSIPVETKILVDEGTQSVVWTTKYRTRVSTDRLSWDQVGKLEYIISQTGGYSVVAVTLDGDRRVIRADTRPLKSDADQYSKLMEKPLEIVDNTRGFHTLGVDENQK